MTSTCEHTVGTARGDGSPTSAADGEEAAMMAPFDALVEAHGVHRTFACTLNNIGAMLYERRRYGAAMGHYQESIQFRTAVRTGTKPTAANGPNENGHPIAPDPSDIPTLTARAVEVWRYYSSLNLDDEFGILYPSDDSSCSETDSSEESDSDSDMGDQARGCSSNDNDDQGHQVMDLRRPACPTIGMLQKNEYSDEGPQWFQSAVHFTAEVMGDCAYESAVTLFNMGLVEMKRNKFGNNCTERAEQLFEMALSLAPGKHYDVIAPVLNNLGRLYYSTGNYADAADAFSEAVELGAEAVKELPLPCPTDEKRSSVTKSSSTRSLMSTSSSSDDNSEFSSSTTSAPEDNSSSSNHVAPLSFGGSVDAEQRDAQPHHLLATSMANLARAHQRQQELSEALEHCLQALHLRRRLHHETHYLVQVALYNVGTLRQQMNDHKGALACYSRFLNWAAGTVGPGHVLSATVMHDMAAVLFDRRNLAGAMPLLLRSLAVREAELGPDHQDVAEVLYTVGRLLHDREEYGDAAEVYGRALRIQERRLGRTHPDVVRTLCNIGRVSHVRGDVVGALEATSRVVAIVQGSEGNEAFLSSTLNFLGNIYLEVGETRLAMSCFAESRSVASGGVTGDGHHHITPSIFVSPLHYRGFNRAHGAAASA